MLGKRDRQLVVGRDRESVSTLRNPYVRSCSFMAVTPVLRFTFRRDATSFLQCAKSLDAIGEVGGQFGSKMCRRL